MEFAFVCAMLQILRKFADFRRICKILWIFTAFYGILLLASMSVLYQRYGNKNAAMRDVSTKQNGAMDLSVKKQA